MILKPSAVFASAPRPGELALAIPAVPNVVTGPGTETGAALGLHNDIDVITLPA